MTAYKTAGNRLPVPTSLGVSHLLYKFELTAPAPDEDLKVIADAVKKMVEDDGLAPSEIEAYAIRQFHDNVLAHAAIKRLLDLMGAQNFPESSASLIACHWASPHVDEYFSGKAFASLVVHTGPERYVLQTLHTSSLKKKERGLDLHRSTKMLKAGEAFVFDPTTPHFSAPVYPHENSLLVLLQVEVKDETPEDRKALLEKFVPRTDNRDEQNEFVEGWGVS